MRPDAVSANAAATARAGWPAPSRRHSRKQRRVAWDSPSSERGGEWCIRQRVHRTTDISNNACCKQRGAANNGYFRQRMRQAAAASREGMTMLERRNFDAFLGTLGTAIHQQQAQVVALDQALEAARRQWQVKKQKLSSYETLEKRAAAAQQQREAKSEQRASDEFAARRARDRAAAAA